MNGLPEYGSGRSFGVLGYWFASGLSLISVLVLAVLAGQALALQEREEARRGREQTIERVAAAAQAFSRDVPGFLTGRAAIELPMQVASLPAFVMPDDEESRSALLGAVEPGDTGRLRLLEAHLNASGAGRLPWKWLLARRGLSDGARAEAERWLREIVAVPASEDCRLANGFSAKMLATFWLAGMLLSENRVAEAQVAVRSVTRFPRPESVIGSMSDLLWPLKRTAAGVNPSLPAEIRADLELLQEGWSLAGGRVPGWYFSSRGLMLVAQEADHSVLYFCDDLRSRLQADLERVSEESGSKALSDHAGSGTIPLPGLPGLFWKMPDESASASAAVDSATMHSRGRMRLGVAVALALVGVSALLLLGLRREQERRLSVSQEAFFAQAAHDLKTPLATLRVLSETLSLGRAASPEKQKKYLEQIIAEVDRSAETVDAMLMAGRLGAGTLEPRVEAVEAKRVFERLLDRFGPRLEGWQVTLAAAEPVFVHADPVMFERVGINLIENALRHASAGKVLEISLVNGPTGFVTVSVADRGAGPGEASREGNEAGELFPTRSRLGLALVDGVVRLHGGTWDLRPRPEGGHLVEVRWISAQMRRD